jgi:hypothetical protein
MTAARQVSLNLESQLRREIAFQVIRQFPADPITVDFYADLLMRHEHHRSMGCRAFRKVTLALLIVFSPTLETFVTIPNPTAT